MYISRMKILIPKVFSQTGVRHKQKEKNGVSNTSLIKKIIHIFNRQIKNDFLKALKIQFSYRVNVQRVLNTLRIKEKSGFKKK